MMETIRSKREGEEGFTLLEILMAMIVLAVGGVSVLSLFAAAVSLQYKSVVSDREAKILPEVVAEAQQMLNLHIPTSQQKVPESVARRRIGETGFDVEISFTEVSGEGTLMPTPPGEGAVAAIQLYYRGKERPVVRQVLQKTVFSREEIKKNVSYEQDKARDAIAESEKDAKEEKEGGSGRPK